MSVNSMGLRKTPHVNNDRSTYWEDLGKGTGLRAASGWTVDLLTGQPGTRRTFPETHPRRECRPGRDSVIVLNLNQGLILLSWIECGDEEIIPNPARSLSHQNACRMLVIGTKMASPAHGVMQYPPPSRLFIALRCSTTTTHPTTQ